MDASPSSSPATWSIAEVERETGLGKDTLRVWERRYGFPLPLRDAHGERTYPQPQVDRLRRIKRLLDAGHRPGQVVPLAEEQLDELARVPSRSAMAGARPTAAAGPSGMPAAGADAAPWLDWLARDCAVEIRTALRERIARDGLGPTVEVVLAPLCGEVGQAWVDGRLSIYQEHLFTELVQAALRDAMADLDAANVPARRPHVLLTTPPDERHGLGLLMAECFFALAGCRRLTLGVSTPVAEIVEAARRLAVDVVALSFSAHARRRDVIDALQQLDAQLPPAVQVWAGGAGVARLRGLPARVLVLRRAGDVTAQIGSWRAAAREV